MPKYKVRLFERVVYQVEVDADTLQELAEEVEGIREEAQFDPIKDVFAVEEREILSVQSESGESISIDPLDEVR